MRYHVRLDDRRVFGNNMKIIITKGYEELSAKALEIMKGVVKSNPYAVLGLATGTTPLGLYSHIAQWEGNYGTYAVDEGAVFLPQICGKARSAGSDPNDFGGGARRAHGAQRTAAAHSHS